mmetsp:Transcript_67023/g.216073  ORF Transcript_67023/g.216073 Transcript_67023/m.216073 type:complete len:217 (-) Transcript_67023:117-767(-)
MPSMAFFTSVNASSWTRTARAASCSWGRSSLLRHAWERPPTYGAWSLPAACSSRAAARPLAASRPLLAARSWRKAPPVPIFLWKRSRTLSSVSMAMVSATALSSSPRASLRFFHSWSNDWHFSRRSERKRVSAARVSRVMPRSSLASERALVLLPWSSCMSSSMAAEVAIHFSEASLSSPKSFSACTSRFCISLRLDSNSLCICLRMAKICPDCEE